MSSADAHYGGELVDGARMLALFGDVATELCVRAYGDEGLFRAYKQVEFLAPVRAGDFIEVEGEIVAWGKTSLTMQFRATKVLSAAPEVSASAADLLPSPVEVCRAEGTCVVPAGLQRTPARPGPVILTAAIVGAETMRSQNPHLPHTPAEIAAEAERCARAGAAVVHLHARTDDGKPTQDRERFRQTIREIRKRVPDLVIQVSTGGAVGMSIEERTQPLTLDGPDAPDMATLNIGTMNFGDDIFVNTWSDAKRVSGLITERKLIAEVEIYDVSHIETARYLIAKELLRPPFHFQLVMGVRGGIGATRRNLEFLLEDLPKPCTWAVAATGRHQLPMASLAIALGGHARVGLEDNIFLEKGVLAEGSAPLCIRAAQAAAKIGRPLATTAEAREILGLKRVPGQTHVMTGL